MEDTNTTLFRSQAEINVWIMKHLERLDVINERFVLEEVEL